MKDKTMKKLSIVSILLSVLSAPSLATAGPQDFMLPGVQHGPGAYSIAYLPVPVGATVLDVLFEPKRNARGQVVPAGQLQGEETLRVNLLISCKGGMPPFTDMDPLQLGRKFTATVQPQDYSLALPEPANDACVVYGWIDFQGKNINLGARVEIR